MVDEKRARVLAQTAIDADGLYDLGDAHEIREGLFFTLLGRNAGPPAVGSNGVIVNKKSGRIFWLGSAFPIKRDLEMYDRGYQFHSYDLVVFEVRNPNRAVSTLSSLGFSTDLPPAYEHGVVWRMSRNLTDDEIRQRLVVLPCVFTGNLYFRLERLEHAREAGYFTFKVLEYVPSRD